MEVICEFAIEMAARGAISGRLKEWPILKYALEQKKIFLDPNTPTLKVVEICREITNENN